MKRFLILLTLLGTLTAQAVEWFPEGDEPAPGDTTLRSLQKINNLLYLSGITAFADAITWFPEGDEPRPGDNEKRSLQKINSLLWQAYGTGGTNTPVFPVRAFDTVADMAASAPVASGEGIAYARGYWTAGDGGGGFFIATNTVTSTNLGTRFESGSHEGYSWDRIIDGPVNVVAFGAKADDSDQTEAIQAAIDTTASLGIKLFFPAEDFSFASRLTVPSNSDIRFDGDARLIFTAVPEESPYEAILVSGDDVKFERVSISGSETDDTWDDTVIVDRSGIKVTGDRFYGQRVCAFNFSTGIQLAGDNGILNASYCTNNWVDSGLSVYHQSSGILVYGGSGNNVYDAEVHGYGQGILGLNTTQNLTVDRPKLYDQIDNGFYISSGIDVTISQAHVRNAGQFAGKGRGFGISILNSIAHDCMVGFEVTPFAQAVATVNDDEEIEYNTFHDLPSTYHFNGGRNSLVGNYVINAQRGGLVVDDVESGGDTLYSHMVIVTGNRLYNSALESNYNAVIIYGDYVNFSDNHIYGWNDYGYGLVVTQPGEGRFMGNIVDGNTIVSPSSDKAVLLYGQEQLNFSHNRITNAVDSVIQIDVQNSQFHANHLGAVWEWGTEASHGNTYFGNEVQGAWNWTVSGHTNNQFLFNRALSFPTDAEANVWQGNREWDGDYAINEIIRYNWQYKNAGIDTAYTTDNSVPFYIRRTRDGNLLNYLHNPSEGTSAAALFSVQSGNSTTASGGLGAYHDSYAGSGAARLADRVRLYANSDSDGLTIDAVNSGQTVDIYAGNTTRQVRISSTGLTIDGSFNQGIDTIAAENIDWSAGNMFSKSIGGNTTFTFSNPTAGQWITVKVTAAGANTVTWPTVTWRGAATPSQTSSKTDFYTFFYDGTTYYGEASQDY